MSRRKGVLIALCLLSSLVLSLHSAPTSRAGTFLFPVQTEQVITGTSTGISGAQADDGIVETVWEADTLADFTTAPGAETIGTGTTVAGAFPADVSSDDGAYINYREADTSSGNSSAAIGYRSNTGIYTINGTKVRTWNAGAWSSESELYTAGSEVVWTRVAYNPGVRPNEYIVVTQSTNQWLDAYVWDGLTSHVTNNIAQADFTGGRRPRAFDIAYEGLSGRAVLVYGVVSTNTARDLAYRIWDGTSWAAEQYIDDTGHATDISYAHVSLAPKPDSDVIAMICVDETNNDANVWIWDGTSWGDNLELAMTLANQERDRQPADVAWESSSLALMAVSGNNAVLNYARFTGSWSSISTLDFNGAGVGRVIFVTLKADPVRTSNYLMLTIQTDAIGGSEGLYTLSWNGSSWTATQQDATPDAGNQGRPADFAWEPSGSKGLLVWGTTNGQITYKTFTAPSTWGTETNVAMGANAHLWVQLRTNPRDVSGDVKVLGAVLEDRAFDLGAIKWDGTTFTVIGATTFSADTTIDTYEFFEIEFKPALSRLEVTYDFSGVPLGHAYVLKVKGFRPSDEDIQVQILTPPSTWNARITVSSTTSSLYSYVLTASEYNGSSPRVRFVDASGPDPFPSDVFLDWVALVTANYRYEAEVLYNVTGITIVSNLVLVVKGNVTAGGENFDVQVWNASASAWDLLLASPFTAANEYHNISLAGDHLVGDTVRLRFVDVGFQDTTAGALSLDFVAVVASNAPGTLADAGVSPTSGLLTTTFAFFVRYVDPENDPPAFVELVLNGTAYAMTESNTADTNYVDGKDYFLDLTIVARGTFAYFFRTQATFGDTSVSSSSIRQVSVENQAPTIANPITADAVDAGRPYVRDFNGTDPDGDSLTWSMATGAPWLSIGPTNGTVWGDAPAASVVAFVNVTVRDSFGGVASTNYTLTVASVSLPPPPSSTALPAVLSYLSLAIGAFALAAFVATRRRRPVVEQAFLLEGDGTVRFAFSPPGALFDESRLRSVLGDHDWRSARAIPAAPHTLHIVRRDSGTWVLVSQNSDASRVVHAAQPLMARAESNLHAGGSRSAEAEGTR